MQHNIVKTCTVSFVIILFLMGSAVTPFLTQKTSSTTINSRVDEIEGMLPSQIHEISFKDVNGADVKEPNTNDGYKPRFFPIYIKGNNALKGLRGRINGVIGGKGTEDDPYIIAGWELKGRKFWKYLSIEYGITIEDVDKHVVIKDNYIHDWCYSIGGDYVSGGIFIGESSNITIENNIVEKNLFGIDSIVSTAIITHNTISQNARGVACGTYSYSIVSNNTICGNYGDGVICSSSHGRVIFNQVFSNGGDGIESVGKDRSFIAHNTVYDNTGDGIVFGGTVGGSSHPIIANNDIFSNGRYGVGCYDPTEAVISNNSIYSNHADGISCRDSDPTIIDNTISSNGGDGIYCSRSSPPISYNMITLNSRGIYCYIVDSAITNNSITNNGKGIVCRSSEPQIHYNNLKGNNYGVTGDGCWPWVDATMNWWGSSDGPGGYGPGSGDPVSNYVDYNPWLTEPNPNAGPR